MHLNPLELTLLLRMATVVVKEGLGIELGLWLCVNAPPPADPCKCVKPCLTDGIVRTVWSGVKDVLHEYLLLLQILLGPWVKCCEQR